MATPQQSQPSEIEKLEAALAKLEAEREQRLAAGKWSRGVRPVLMAIPQAGEALEAVQQRALHEYLAKHPDAPQSIHAYGWFELEIVDPPPIVEPPAAQWDTVVQKNTIEQ